jgi:FKBP-type peptidyl-prolyl cis-trans isomerase FkpA
MKKYFLLLSIFVITIASCKKDSFDPAKQAAKDDTAIQAYITANNITGTTKDASGVYYKVITPGTGAFPTVNSNVAVNYTGSILNGATFAPAGSNLPLTPLTGLIKGWQIGIPHINAGGRILLIIPSGLGYGNSSPGAGIPANAVLIFTIDLLNFTN